MNATLPPCALLEKRSGRDRRRPGRRMRQRAAGDLRPDRRFASGPAHKLRAQVAIREPVASLDLDSQRILVRTGPETIAYLAGAQWSDRLPSLVQTRLVQTFQNAQLLRSVARAGGGPAADYSLELDIRAFELDVAAAQANVDIAAKIVAATSGRVIAARIFKIRVPAARHRRRRGHPRAERRAVGGDGPDRRVHHRAV